MMEKADTLPTIDQVIKMSEMDKNFDSKLWNKDQKADFYLGMLAGIKLGVSAIVDIRDNGDLDKADLWLLKRSVEAAKIVIDKYELHSFKS